MERGETREGQGQRRPQDDALARGPEMRRVLAARPAEEREAVFDIADFAAIAHFAGICRTRRTG